MKKIFLILAALFALAPAFAEFDDDIFISVGEFSLYFG